MADVGLTLTFEDRQLLDKMRELLTLMDQAEDQAVDTSEAMKNAFGSVAKAADAPQKGLNRIKGGLGEIARVAGGVIGADLFQGLVTGAGQAISELKDLAIEQDALSRKSKTVLGPSFNDIEEAAKSSAAALGLSTSEYVSNAAAVADILKPMGFYTDEAAQMAEQTIELSGALAEWTGGQLSAADVSEILTKAYTGERESLKQLGIVISENDVKNRLAVKGLDNLTGKYLEQAKAAATLELITEKSIDAQTSFAENTDSLIRQQAELNAKLTTVKENIATALIPVFSRLLSVADGIAQGIKNLTELFGSNEEAVNKQAEAIRKNQFAFNAQIATLKRANLSEQDRIELIDEINSKYGVYLDNLIDERDGLHEIEQAQKAANDAFQGRLILLALEDEITELTAAYKESIKSAAQAEGELARLNEGLFTDREKAIQELGTSGQKVLDLEKSIVEGSINAAQDRIDVIPEQIEKVQSRYEILAERLGTTIDDLRKKFGTITPDTTPNGPLKDQEKLLNNLLSQYEKLAGAAERSNVNQLEGLQRLEEERRLAIKSVEDLRDTILKSAKDAGQDVELDVIKLPTGEELDVGSLVDSLFADINSEYDKNVKDLQAKDFAEQLANFDQKRELRSDELADLQSHYNNLLNEDEKYRVARLSNEIQVTNEQIQLLRDRASQVEDIEERDGILRDITPLLQQVRAQQNEITQIITTAKVSQLDQERILAEKRIELIEENEGDILSLEDKKQKARLELQKAYLQRQLAIQQATNGFDSFEAQGLLLDIELIDKALEELGEDSDPAKGWLERLKSNLAEALGVTTDELDQLANQIGDAFDNIAAKQLENTERLIDQNERVIDSIQRRSDSLERDLEREIELAEAGLANNVEIKKQELEIIRKQEDKALKDREKLEKQAARQRLIRDAAEQTSNLVSAATIIFKEGVSTFGIIGGLIAAGAAIISLFAAFKAVKQQAASATRLYKGGKLADHMKGERDHGLIKPGGSSDKPGAGKGYRIEGTNIIVGGNERVMSEGAVKKFDPILEAMEQPGASMDNLNEILSKVPSYDPDKHISKETVERISNINSTSQKFREQIIKEHDHVIKIESQEGKGLDKKIEKAVDKAVDKHIQRLIDFQKNRTERVVIPKDVDRMIEYKGSDKKIIRNP